MSFEDQTLKRPDWYDGRGVEGIVRGCCYPVYYGEEMEGGIKILRPFCDIKEERYPFCQQSKTHAKKLEPHSVIPRAKLLEQKILSFPSLKLETSSSNK